MNDPDWYSDWRHEAFHELQDKNARVEAEFRIGQWPRFDYDVDQRTLIFSKENQPKVLADIQVAGTTSRKAGSWLWAWANSDWPTECTADSERACEFGELHGIGELISGYVEDDDLNSLGWQLTAVTARVCDAVGAYRPPRGEDGGLFLLYRNVRW